jgi:endonuclease/exonuclease/phosphatase family metal-dependent hydrolase
VALLAVAASAAQFESSTARIAAWNLEGFQPIPDERLDKQADALAMLDAEVIAIVEVQPVTALESLKNKLNAMGLCYDFRIIDQTAIQDLGILFKCGVTVANERLVPGSNLGDPARRNALVADVTVDKFDFVMIVVHLKSGRDAADQATRDQQAQVIGAFIENQLLQAPREDILLVGDFNMIPGQDVSNFHHLGGADRMDFISSWDLQDRFSHILEKGRANLLDGFAITRTFTTEYVRGSLRVFPLHWALDIGLEEFRATVSDHLPFVTSFRIVRDAD